MADRPRLVLLSSAAAAAGGPGPLFGLGFGGSPGPGLSPDNPQGQHPGHPGHPLLPSALGLLAPQQQSQQLSQGQQQGLQPHPLGFLPAHQGHYYPRGRGSLDTYTGRAGAVDGVGDVTGSYASLDLTAARQMLLEGFAGAGPPGPPGPPLFAAAAGGGPLPPQGHLQGMGLGPGLQSHPHPHLHPHPHHAPFVGQGLMARRSFELPQPAHAALQLPRHLSHHHHHPLGLALQPPQPGAVVPRAPSLPEGYALQQQQAGSAHAGGNHPKPGVGRLWEAAAPPPNRDQTAGMPRPSSFIHLTWVEGALEEAENGSPASVGGPGGGGARPHAHQNGRGGNGEWLPQDLVPLAMQLGLGRAAAGDRGERPK